MYNAKIILTAIALFASASLFFTAPAESKTLIEAQTANPENAAPKYALLVGVNRYKKMPAGQGIGDLKGAHNDVELVKSLLVLDDYGFVEDLKTEKPPVSAPCGEQKPTSGIKTLCSEQATKAAILSAFDNHLIKNAENYWKVKGTAPVPANGPTLFFYYSGHGAYVRDDVPMPGEDASESIVGDEADGLDETLVPHDSDQVGSRDIRDDSFQKRMEILKKFTSNVIFMSDSCHSGTNSRGEIGKKGFVRDLSGFVPKTGSRGDGDGRDNMVAGSGYVTISGSKPTESSFERPLAALDTISHRPTRHSQWNGLLTYHFVLQSRENPGATYREIIGLVRNAVDAADKIQTPQVEGDIDRQVLGSAVSRNNRSIAIKCRNVGTSTICSEKVEKTSTDGVKSVSRKITMDVGHIVGARMGGYVAIYSPEATKLVGDENKIGYGIITYSDAFSSEAEIQLTDPNAEDLKPLAKAVLVSPNFTDSARLVAIDFSPGKSSNDPGLVSMRKLAEELKKDKYVSPVEMTGVLATLGTLSVQDTKTWEIAVVRGTYADFKVGLEKNAGSKNVPPADTQDGYFLSNRNGEALYDLWVPADSPNAAEKFQAALEAHIKATNIRAMKNDASALNGQLKVEMVRYKGFRIKGRSDCDLTEFSDEELSKMEGQSPRLRTSEAFYLNITNSSDKPLYFYIYSVDPAGAIGLLYPASGAQETIKPGLTFSTTSGFRCRVNYFDQTSPTGSEMVKIIASETEIQANLLTSPGVARSKGGPDSPLERLLRQAGSNTRTVANDGRVGEWTTYEIEYTVVR